MPTERCPRCNKAVEPEALTCPSCDFHLRYAGDVHDSGKRRGFSFFGLPRFLMKQGNDWTPPEVKFPFAGGWKALMAYIIAGVIIAVYRAPLLHFYDRLRGMAGSGLSVKVDPNKEVKIGHAVAREIGDAAIQRAPLTRAAWIFSGTVYDLITTKPVPQVNLVFEDVAKNKRFTVSSHADGHFEITLPEATAEGYYLKIRNRKYHARAIIENAKTYKPLRLLTVAQRRKVEKDFLRTFNRPKLVSPAGSGSSWNLFLLPINPS